MILLTLLEIAFEYCPFDVASSFTEPDYKEKCREVATGGKFFFSFENI